MAIYWPLSLAATGPANKVLITTMALALFDLDDTLINGNCETEWFHFLSDHGVIKKDSHLSAFEEFDRLYLDGELDIMDYMRFILKPLVDNELDNINELHHRFVIERMKPLVPQAARDLVEQHRQRGDVIVIITACNDFNAIPVAALFDVAHVIATEAETVNGDFTGEAVHPASFAEGKVTRLKQWLQVNDCSLEGSYFYSDSRNDLPLLELADHPVAVDPDPVLRQVAETRNWPCISLHGKS